MLTDQQRKRAFNIITLTQCLGMLTAAFFQNGFYLNYFTKLGISSASIAFLFALPALLGAFLMIPFAFWADRAGKLRLALSGQVMVIASLVLLMAAGWLGPRMVMPAVVLSILVFSIGGSLQGASWFALLNPIIPSGIRGRFFGRLRVTFQTVTILFTIAITKALGISDAMLTFQIIIAVVFVAHILRYFTYAQIPELEKEHQDQQQKQSFKESIRSVFCVEGFVRFNAYVLLITLFTGGIPIVFGLMQKDVFGFSAAQITTMGTLFLLGSVPGNLVGGKLVDHFGTRKIFLLTHIAFAFIIFGMLIRHTTPWSLMIHVGLFSFLFSFFDSIKGIAVTSEMMGLIPSANRSLSTAVCISLFSLGMAVCGLFVSQSIQWKVWPETWSVWGQHFTIYDTLLLIFAVMTLLLLAAIGMVPKIIKKAQLLPGSGYPRI